MDHKNLEISFLTGYLKWKSGDDNEATRNLGNAFTLIKNDSKKVSVDENRDCDLFLNWINIKLPDYQKRDIRVALPQLYTQFDQYLKTTRQQ